MVRPRSGSPLGDLNSRAAKRVMSLLGSVSNLQVEISDPNVELLSLLADVDGLDGSLSNLSCLGKLSNLHLECKAFEGRWCRAQQFDQSGPRPCIVCTENLENSASVFHIDIVVVVAILLTKTNTGIGVIHIRINVLK
ncbi:hypothetical protein HG531_007400 [Fusarium graminearum]|nr:hypothetical protein HG531_007400 [Fusarium graminearum]